MNLVEFCGKGHHVRVGQVTEQYAMLNIGLGGWHPFTPDCFAAWPPQEGTLVERDGRNGDGKWHEVKP